MKREYANRFFNLESLKEKDIIQVGGLVSVDYDNLTDNTIWEYGLDDGEGLVIDYTDIYNESIVKNCDSIDYNSYYFDNEIWEDFVTGLMNTTYNHYLVYLKNSTWNGLTGVKIVDSYKECFIRDYDTSMYYEKSSVNGKVLILREYSHDVPTGHDTIIIGLTEKEFEKMDNDFDTNKIIEFALAKYNQVEGV
jgi:hypothetical protein